MKWDRINNNGTPLTIQLISMSSTNCCIHIIREGYDKKSWNEARIQAKFTLMFLDTNYISLYLINLYIFLTLYFAVKTFRFLLSPTSETLCLEWWISTLLNKWNLNLEPSGLQSQAVPLRNDCPYLHLYVQGDQQDLG